MYVDEVVIVVPYHYIPRTALPFYGPTQDGCCKQQLC